MWLRLRGRRLQKPPVIRPQCSRREGAGDNRRGASGVERRARFQRGETSEGGKPRDGLRHETRPRSSSEVKPLRGCESLRAAPEATLGRVVSRGETPGATFGGHRQGAKESQELVQHAGNCRGCLGRRGVVTDSVRAPPSCRNEPLLHCEGDRLIGIACA